MTQVITSANNRNTKYTDFYPRFKKEAAYYEKERTANGKPWPRAKRPEEIAYDNFLAETVDPSTGDYFTDNVTGLPAGKYVVESIQRVKLLDGSEVLLSQGHIYALDYHRHRKSFYCDKPEMHLKTLFNYRTRMNSRNQVESICIGPFGKPEPIYELPFTPENLDKLWSMRRDNNISLIMKTEMDGVAHSLDRKGLVKSNDSLGAYNLFKTADFDYIFNWEYTKQSYNSNLERVPDPEAKKEFEKIQNKTVITKEDDIGTVFDDIDSKNTKSKSK